MTTRINGSVADQGGRRLAARWGAVVLESIVALAMIGVLALTVVWGAANQTERAGRSLRLQHAKERAFAEKYAVDPRGLARGRAQYMTTCTACHGPNGEAKPNLGKDLAHSEFVAKSSDSEMVRFLKLGRGPGEEGNTTGVAMPPKGGNPVLKDQDLKEIVAFLRFLQETRGN